MPNDSRKAALSSDALDWVGSNGWFDARLEALAGDVSSRRYFRLTGADGATCILATYPVEIRSGCARFASAHHLLGESGIRVPAILATDSREGLMLLEDVGDEMLFDRRHLAWSDLAVWMERAAGLAAAVAELPSRPVAALNPPLDGTLLSRELVNTWRLALGHTSLVEAGLPTTFQSALEEMLRRLGKSPQVPCHRDYMARNLVPLDDTAELCLLDFQDLRIGPAAYDLASLMNDSLYPPMQIEESILRRYLPARAERDDYHRCVAQRSLKIVGTFIGFAQRGSTRYLPLIEPTLDRSRRALQQLPELQACGTDIDRLANALLAATKQR